MDIAKAILYLVPGANCAVWNNSYDEIDWQDERSLPTLVELEAVWPEVAAQEFIGNVVIEVQNRLDAFARTRNYDGILSAATYATSTVPKFKVEGQYAVEARDATWATCYEVLAEVEAGTRPMQTLDELLAELPILEWPDA